MPYANQKIREIWMNFFITTLYTTKEIISKLQEIKCKTKLKFYKKLSNYYDEMKFRNFIFEQDPFAKNAQGNSKLYHEVFLSMKFLQTKPYIRNMYNNYFDLYYTVIKNGEDKEIVNDDEHVNFNDFITPNHYVRIKPRETILK